MVMALHLPTSDQLSHSVLSAAKSPKQTTSNFTMKRRCSEERDSRRGKRVRFTDNEVDHDNLQSLRFNASSVPVGALKATRRSDDAKTSEFAFFKKLKENAGQKFTSHCGHTDLIDQSNKVGPRNASEDSMIKNSLSRSANVNVINNGSDKIRSSFWVENATPVRFVAFKSSLDSADARTRNACASFNDLQQTPQDVEEYCRPFMPQGNQYGNAEIFSMKRQKLRRWVKDISSPEVEGVGLKGDDIVFKLLSRLIPERKDNNSLKDQRLKLGQLETGPESILPAYPNSDLVRNNLRQITPRASIEHEFWPYLGDDILYHQSSQGRILRLDAPYSLDNSTNHWPKVWESDSELNGENQPLCTNSYSHFAFPIRRFSSIELVEELGEICQPNRSLVGTGFNTRMLGWEFDSKKPEDNLPIGFQDIEPVTYPTAVIPWVNHSKFDGQGSSPLSSIHFNDEPEGSLSLSLIPSYNSREYGTSVIEAEDKRLSESKNLPLPVSCSKGYFSPVKEFHNDTGFLNQDHWFLGKILNHHSRTESLLPTELDFGLDNKIFPVSGLYSSSYRLLEDPTNRSLIPQYNEYDEYRNRQDDSCHIGTLACFGEADENSKVLFPFISRQKMHFT